MMQTATRRNLFLLTFILAKLSGGRISVVLLPAFASSSLVAEDIIFDESTILASPKSQI